MKQTITLNETDLALIYLALMDRGEGYNTEGHALTKRCEELSHYFAAAQKSGAVVTVETAEEKNA